MPNVITHYLFAREVSSMLQGLARDAFLNAPGAYYLGAEGPDAFYPLRELHDPAARLANRMHRGDVLNVFQLIAESSGDPIVFAYGLGLMTHYVLDKTVHPLVYFLTEEGLPRFYDGVFQRNLHNIAESAADEACLLAQGENPRNFDVCRAMNILAKEKRQIAKLYRDQICPYFGYYTNSTKLALSFTLTNLFGILWKDKRGYKRKLFTAMERRFSDMRNLTALLRPVPAPKGVDLLNTRKVAYPNPRNSQNFCRNSFIEAYQQAKADVVVYLQKFNDAVTKKTSFCSADFAISYEGIDVTIL